MVWARCTRRVATAGSRGSRLGPLAAPIDIRLTRSGSTPHLGLADQPVDQAVQHEAGDQAHHQDAAMESGVPITTSATLATSSLSVQSLRRCRRARRRRRGWMAAKAWPPVCTDHRCTQVVPARRVTESTPIRGALRRRADAQPISC